MNLFKYPSIQYTCVTVYMSNFPANGLMVVEVGLLLFQFAMKDIST